MLTNEEVKIRARIHRIDIDLRNCWLSRKLPSRTQDDVAQDLARLRDKRLELVRILDAQ